MSFLNKKIVRILLRATKKTNDLEIQYYRAFKASNNSSNLDLWSFNQFSFGHNEFSSGRRWRNDSSSVKCSLPWFNLVLIKVINWVFSNNPQLIFNNIINMLVTINQILSPKVWRLCTTLP